MNHGCLHNIAPHTRAVIISACTLPTMSQPSLSWKITLGSTFIVSSGAACFLPIPLVRILPLPAWLILYQWLYDEYNFLRPWLREVPGPERVAYNAALGKYYTSWRDSLGTITPAISLPITWISCVRLAYADRSDSTRCLLWLGGLAGAIAHMPAGGKEFPLTKIMAAGGSEMKDGKEKDALGALGTWLDMHRWRLIWVDTIPLICFGAAAVLAARGG